MRQPHEVTHYLIEFTNASVSFRGVTPNGNPEFGVLFDSAMADDLRSKGFRVNSINDELHYIMVRGELVSGTKFDLSIHGYVWKINNKTGVTPFLKSATKLA